MQDEMMDLMDVSNEIQETLGRSYNVPDDIDEEELMGGPVQSYWQFDFSLIIICKRHIFSQNCIHCYKAYEEEEQTHFSLCCPHFVSWKMQSSMLWKLTWTLNQRQSHLTSNQNKNLNSTYLLHQLAKQQSQQTSSR
jgi:hypothetical protein